MSKTSFFSTILMVVLAACAQPNEVGRATYLSSEPVIQMTAVGIGAINAETPYSRAAIVEALPGFEFANVTTMSEGEVRHLLAAFRGGMQQLQFEPGTSGKIARVHIVGQEAAGPNGERIGMTYTESGAAALNCVPGAEEWSRMALCTTPDRRLVYIYAPEAYEGPDGQLPPDNILRSSRLVRIVWNPHP